MRLTKEHFDQQLNNFQININGQIRMQAEELKTCISESFEAQRDFIEGHSTKVCGLL
jgi:hypothetical protein